jgi:uracil-DNA glycosylase
LFSFSRIFFNEMAEKTSDSKRFGIENDWYERLSDEFSAEYFGELREFVRNERQHHDVYPAPHNVFAALNATAFSDVRVVILGQDPYHGPGQAHGLCFSVQRGVPVPPSLANIFTELHNDLDIPRPTHGCLTSWAQQGVLLLNTTLTVRRGEAGSHQGKGWERFTDHIISMINDTPQPVAFVLWGAPARRKTSLVTSPLHTVIEAPHPSPLSAHRGFFDSRPFSAINNFMIRHGYPSISWSLD